VMDGDNSSKNDADVWLARCDSAHAAKTNEIIACKDLTKHISSMNYIMKEEHESVLYQPLDKINSKKSAVDFQNLVNPYEKMKEERRTSSILQEAMLGDVSLHPPVGGQKRTAEGTQIPPSNSLSILDNNEILNRANKMGVAVDDSSFHSIDLIKELELAKYALNKKSDISQKPSGKETMLVSWLL